MTTINEYTGSLYGLEGKTALVTGGATGIGLMITHALVAAGARVRAYDPVAIPRCAAERPSVDYCAGAYETCEGADAVAVITEWNEFRRLDLDRIKAALKEPYFFDLKNVYSPAEVAAKGLHYVGLGRSAGAAHAGPSLASTG